ncbi:MAG: ABC transporter substrate-binding protein [Bacillota bacterium]|nr:ABC transporter substrate-binding protein [Bacillota bacterium]
MRKKAAAILCAISLCILPLTACQGAVELLGQEPEEETRGVLSQEVIIPMEKVTTLNPAVSNEEDTYHIGKLIYEGLFSLDKTLAPVGELAESWEYGEDGDSLTITLRQGVLWHDGEAFTAEDVVFSIEAHQRYGGAGLSPYGSSVAGIRSARAVDASTVLIAFSDPQNAALENLTFPILPQHQFRNLSALGSSDSGFVPIGTGPYKVLELDMSSHLTLTGHENHWEQVPGNVLTFKILPDKSTAVNLFDIYEYSLTIMKEPDREALLSSRDAAEESFPSNEAEVLGFNTARVPLSDSRVRQAAALAADAERILSTCYYNSGILCDSIYYPGYLGTEAGGDPYEYDISQATALLDQAGCADADGDGYRESPEGEEMELLLLVSADNEGRTAAAELVRAGLEEAGLRVQVRALPFAEFEVALAEGDYDLFLGGYRFRETYDLRSLLHSSGNPVTGYADATLDLYLDQMQSAVSLEEKRAALASVKEILIRELPYYCLLYKTYGFVASPYLQGEQEAMFNDHYRSAASWSCEYTVTTE